MGRPPLRHHQPSDKDGALLIVQNPSCSIPRCGPKMKFTSLLFVCFLTELTLGTQGLVSVSNVTAECGKSVTIRCNVSKQRDGLSVKHMEWSQNHKPLCQVNSGGELKHSKNTKSDFRCEYQKGQLSLIFEKVLPEDSGASNRYMCKLRSNWGISHGYSWIELQECCGTVKGVLTKDGPVCTFSDVYPDAEVLWSHASQSQPEAPGRQSTFKSVEEGGWVTIRSQLEGNSNGAFNCTLKRIDSGRQIVCNSSEDAQILDGYGLKPQGFTQNIVNGSGALDPFMKILLISILVVIMQK
ncbi:uncharacterized protein LOC109511407 isoform X2 [Hippocampus comes]|uniref:uncharacterized protein LOC109511407 isoform X2 n=1 Tax=Hippocampus comes TaxID=109280 RepID=UPI00094ED10E|nr:PREDICTED: uncharacterized protein LOC109511407 isoform X2 [Hippocampus comes]